MLKVVTCLCTRHVSLILGYGGLPKCEEEDDRGCAGHRVNYWQCKMTAPVKEVLCTLIYIRHILYQNMILLCIIWGIAAQ